MSELKMQKKPRKPKELENQPGKYDPRNKLNDLTGKEWLLLTKSFWETEPSPLDKTAYAHPAPFLIKDVQKLISMFTKKEMTVLDPFVGSGTTLIACNEIGRNGIGIDLNENYRELFNRRLSESNIELNSDIKYVVGNSLYAIQDIGMVDYIVTSPPYFNILKNDSKGTRNNSGKAYRMAAREGIDFYSDLLDDIGNFDKYDDFISALEAIMGKAYQHLNNKKYATIIMSDFTVNKKEQPVQGDIISMMNRIGFEFCGTTVLLQPVKPLYPFGYPYAYKINHHHQNLMTFRKVEI
ncbi:DNA methyltransferase [Caproiciproducens sp.]|uniref:DNA methyltransferase n=1 Tax=Caproiciproducens sp. TaxID=1954376 RepID=UPI00289EF6CE|nr:DNA methyltransferase [Caproiciproducens sp.]